MVRSCLVRARVSVAAILSFFTLLIPASAYATEMGGNPTVSLPEGRVCNADGAPGAFFSWTYHDDQGNDFLTIEIEFDFNTGDVQYYPNRDGVGTYPYYWNGYETTWRNLAYQGSGITARIVTLEVDEANYDKACLPLFQEGDTFEDAVIDFRGGPSDGRGNLIIPSARFEQNPNAAPGMTCLMTEGFHATYRGSRQSPVDSLACDGNICSHTIWGQNPIWRASGCTWTHERETGFVQFGPCGPTEPTPRVLEPSAVTMQ